MYRELNLNEMKCEEFKTLKYEVHVNNIYKLNHFHKNGTLLRYKDQLVNAVQKKLFILQIIRNTQIHSWRNAKLLNVEVGSINTYSYLYGSKG
jgi:hypothetical protein